MIKRTAFLAAVAVVLLAMLAASPATARSVYNGDTIYVGEESLDLSPVFNAPPVVLSGEGDLPDQPGCETTASYETLSVSSGTLVYYSSISTPSSGTVGQTIAVADVSKFLVLQEVVGLRGKPPAGTEEFRKTDVHTNGVIDVGDALFIAQYNVGLRDIWFALL